MLADIIIVKDGTAASTVSLMIDAGIFKKGKSSNVIERDLEELVVTTGNLRRP